MDIYTFILLPFKIPGYYPYSMFFLKNLKELKMFKLLPIWFHIRNKSMFFFLNKLVDSLSTRVLKSTYSKETENNLVVRLKLKYIFLPTPFKSTTFSHHLAFKSDFLKQTFVSCSKIKYPKINIKNQTMSNMFCHMSSLLFLNCLHVSESCFPLLNILIYIAPCCSFKKVA